MLRLRFRRLLGQDYSVRHRVLHELANRGYPALCRLFYEPSGVRWYRKAQGMVNVDWRGKYSTLCCSLFLRDRTFDIETDIATVVLIAS